jgi:ribosomal protein S18 acetylase RimI-like enzyme
MSSSAPAIAYRPATEEDHAAIIEVADEWAGGRHVRATLPWVWLRHFASTSLVAETADGLLAGFLIGFVSPDRRGDAAMISIGVRPRLRRNGIGRELISRFGVVVKPLGATAVETVVWPGDQVLVRFLTGIGFRVEAGPGTQNRYGTPSFSDLDGEHEDRAIFRLSLH